MSVVGGALAGRDFPELGRMHMDALPESMVSRIGARYAASFYRYLARSPHEAVFFERDETGTGAPVGACIVSQRPQDLSRRLLWHTPLLPLALAALPRLLRRKGAAAPAEAGVAQPEGPEVILIFVRPDRRSDGCGARLLARAEAWLAQAGATRLYVKTLADPGNRAIAFYLRSGFELLGSLRSNGKELKLFQKQLGAS